VFMGSAVPEHMGRSGTVAADVPARTMFGPDWNNGSFRDLLESAPDAMVIVDGSWEIVLVNRRLRSCSDIAARSCSAGVSRCW
jgi:PAS domain-containing protein